MDTQPSQQQTTPSPAQVRAQLERMLASPLFSPSRRLSAFLRFVTERALSRDSAPSPKQYTIGLEVYQRGPDFDPRSDPIVRIEAGRLRRTLQKYYDTLGHDDPVIVNIPRGTYTPKFKWAKSTTHSAEQEHTCRQRPSKNPHEPVLAVFPLENRIGPAYDYFVDGLGEELTAALSSFPQMRVIAYCSVLSCNAHYDDLLQAARSLNVDFALAGNLRLAGERLHIRFWMLNTASGEQLWSERFEEQPTPATLFSLEDRIVGRISAQLCDNHGVITRLQYQNRASRSSTEPSTHEAILRGWHYELTFSMEAFRSSRLALERAAELTPDNAMVWAMLSQLLLDSRVFELANIDGAIRRGLRCADKAISLDPTCQMAQHARAYTGLIRRDCATIVEAANAMHAINPYAASMTAAAGFWLCVAGEYERGIHLVRSGMQLNPRHPPWLHIAPCFYHLRNDNIEQALYHAEAFALPDFFWGPLIRAAVLGMAGRRSDAREAFYCLQELRPDVAADPRHHIEQFALDGTLANKILLSLNNTAREATEHMN